MQPRLLVIDDDTLFHDDIVLLLGKHFTIENALNSQSAIEMLRGNEYDLILLDLAMPAFLSDRDECEGLAIYQWMRKNNMPGKVAIVTGQDHLLNIVAKEVDDKTSIYRKPLKEIDLRSIIASLPES